MIAYEILHIKKFPGNATLASVNHEESSEDAISLVLWPHDVGLLKLESTQAGKQHCISQPLVPFSV